MTIPRRISAIAVLVGLVVLLGAVPALAAPAVTDIPFQDAAFTKSLPAPHQLTRDEAKAAIALTGDPYLHDGREPDLVLTLFDFDPVHAGPHVVPFWKEYVGAHSDVYVGWNDLTPPPTSSQQDHTITPAQIAYLGGEFDSKIWASDVFHFGNYASRVPKSLTPEQAAAFDGKRAAIMVYNIRDEAYWSSYRFYTAGYFWGGLNNELGLNAVFIDSYNWVDRIGSDVLRPHLYEGTIAHEFQHLIHNDVSPGDDTFRDEGMADLAEQFIYGPETTASHIGEYLYYHRDSLIDWKGELFDYGNAALWQDYLWERAGGGTLGAPMAGRVASGHDPFADDASKFTDSGDRFIWNEIHSASYGLAGIAELLPGGMQRVEQYHRDFTLANLLDGKVTEAQWNYRNLVLGGADSDGLSVDDGIAFYQSNVNGNMPPTRKNVRRKTAVEPWGAYYRTFGGPEPGITMNFTGLAKDGVLPYSPPTEWYSGLGNLLDITVARQYAGVAPGSVLSFRTWFDIEENWDYGYVEASSDGVTWTKLPQLSTLPAGTTNSMGSSAYDGPGGLTGNSGGWQPARYDLAGFSGDVQVRFRYRTDEAANGQGWYVDDVQVDDGPADAIDSAAGWTTNGWLFTTGLQSNDWTADAFAPYAKAGRKAYNVFSLVGVNATNPTGSAYINTQYLKNGKVYGIVANRPDGTFASEGRLTITKGK